MSALPKHENDSVLAELPQPKGPGARLKAARQSKDIELDKAAAQLHLRRDMLIALEEDDYDQLPARVFVVGYMKNYARYVGLPAEAIIQSLDNFLPPEDKQKAELPKIGNETRDVFKPESTARKSPFSFLSLLLLVAAVAAFFAWNEGYFDTATTEISQSLSMGGTLPDAASEPEILDSSSNLNNLMQIDSPTPDSSGFQTLDILPLPPVNEVVETVETEAVASNLPAKAALQQIPAENTMAIEAETLAVVDAPLPVANVSAEPVAVAKDNISPTTDAGVSSGIVLQLSGKSWLEVRDASGKFKINNLYPAGTRKTFSGNPPYKVLIGNAAQASILIDGKAFDVKSHTNANVARFTLDPAAL